MNLVAPDLKAEVLIMVLPSWEFRVICPKMDPADRLALVRVMFDAAQAVADQFGVRVERKT